MTEHPPPKDGAFLSNEKALKSLAQRITRSEHDAEDVLQEVWLELLKNQDQEVRSPAGWLRVVTLRTAMRHRRRAKDRIASERRGARDLEAPSFVDRLAGELSLAQLCAEVNRLQDPFRSVIRMRYIQELTYTEIAERLDISEGTARSQVKRGLHQLRTKLGDKRSRFMGVIAALVGIRASGIRTRKWAVAGIPALFICALVYVGTLAGDPTVDPLSGRTAHSPTNRTDSSANDLAPVALRASSEDSASLAIQSSRGRATIAGRVLLPNGEPAPNARICAVEANSAMKTPNGAQANVQTTTDYTGAFSLSEALLDTYLWAEHDTNSASARFALFSLSAPDRSELVLRLEEAAEIVELRLVDEFDAPVEGASVIVGYGRPRGPAWNSTGQLVAQHFPSIAESDDEGLVMLKSEVEDRRVLAWRDGFAPASTFTRHAVQGRLELTLGQGNVIEGRVLDQDGQSVRGAQVTFDRPIEAAFVGQAPPRMTTTDSQGVFRINRVPDGDHVLRAQLPIDPWAGSAVVRGQFEPGGSDFAWHDLVLDQTHSVSGVVAADHLPKDSLSVRLGEPDDPGFLAVPVDDQGRFVATACEFSESRVLLVHEKDGIEHVVDRIFNVRPGTVDCRLEPPTTPLRAHGQIDFLPELQDRVVQVELRANSFSGGKTTCSAAAPHFEFQTLPARHVIRILVPGLGQFQVDPKGVNDKGEIDFGLIEIPSPVDLRVHIPNTDQRLPSRFELWCAGTIARSSFTEDLILTSSGFRIPGLLPGKYVLNAWYDEAKLPRTAFRIDQSDADVSLRVPDSESVLNTKVEVFATPALELNEYMTLEMRDRSVWVQLFSSTGRRKRATRDQMLHRGHYYFPPGVDRLRARTSHGRSVEVEINGDTDRGPKALRMQAAKR